MKLAILLFICVLSARQQEPEEYPKENEVVILKNSTFDDFIAKHPYVFVKFYAQWSSHCKAMEMFFTALALKLKGSDILVAQVDAKAESELASRFNIKGYPTMKFFINGDAFNYEGKRTEEEMFNYIMKKIGHASEELKNEADLKALSLKGVSVLMFLPRNDEEALSAFNSAAMKYESLSFKYSFDDMLKSKYGDQKYILIVFRNFDDGQRMLALNETPTAAQMKEFIGSVRFPLVSEFDEATAERVFSHGGSAMFFFTDNPENPSLVEFKKYANDNPEAIIFSWVKISEGMGAKLANYIGVDPTEDPTARIVRVHDDNVDKYRVSILTPAGYSKALEEFASGTLTPYYKSQPIPETNNAGVKIVVSHTFEDIVIHNDKYVMLEAYAPWCGHCKQLEPFYNELGEVFKDDDSIVIAKIDATANENISLKIEAYPTILFYKPGEKDKPLLYKGNRDLEALYEYIEQQTGRTSAENFKETTDEL